jgi:hypothetical protein
MLTVDVPELQAVERLPPVANNWRSEKLTLSGPLLERSTILPALTTRSVAADPDVIVSVIAGLVSATGVSALQFRFAANARIGVKRIDANAVADAIRDVFAKGISIRGCNKTRQPSGGCLLADQ